MKKIFWIGLLIVGASLVTRLPWLDQPREVIFDEVHFGKFVNAYCCTGEHFFDIHPPHAKLLIAGVARLSGYDGSQQFEKIGEKYGPDVPIIALRIIPALAGALLPLIIFVLLLQLGASKKIALLGALLVIFDNAFVVQSRFISLDSVLLLATFGSLSAFLQGISSKEEKVRWSWFILAGVLAGLAAGTKFTGLAAIATIGFITIIKTLRRPRPLSLIPYSILLITSAAVVYLGGWQLHDMLLTEPGSGDAFYARDVSLITKHEVMLSSNYNLTANHPYASHWWSWPLMQRPVFYWQGESAKLYFLGNPLVWWAGGLLFVVAAVSRVIPYLRQGQKSVVISQWSVVLLAGFIISFIPLIRVPRALFLYHYLTPLLFSLLFGLLWLDLRITGHKSLITIVVSALAIVLFIFFSPLTYGYGVPEIWQEALAWLPTWR